MRGPHGYCTAKCDARVGFLSILVVSIPLRVRMGVALHPYGPRTGPVWYEKHLRFSCGARTMHTAMSSRTGPVAWYDHENSTDVKVLRALHLALRAKNRTGDKNRTGPVVGCHWGITWLKHVRFALKFNLSCSGDGVWRSQVDMLDAETVILFAK